MQVTAGQIHEEMAFIDEAVLSEDRFRDDADNLFSKAFEKAGEFMDSVENPDMNLNAAAFGENLGYHNAVMVVKGMGLKSHTDPKWKLYEEFKKGFIRGLQKG